MQASRDALSRRIGDWGGAAHAGLILSRFLQEAVPRPGNEEDKGHPESRRDLYDAARRAVSPGKDLYLAAFDRWCEQRPAGPDGILKVDGRLIVGLGGDNVLETGITLHHTYGVPVIPGSALKGVAAHYCDRIWGARDREDSQTTDRHKFRRLYRGEKPGQNGLAADAGAIHEVLFGTTDDSGHITFHDAWITPESLTGNEASGLVLDVMTPHHGDYYSGRKWKAGPQKDHLMPPSDFDDPNPVTFLSVTGSFFISVSCDIPGDEGQQWATLALELLREALREWGVGGKTSSGYGRLIPDPVAQAKAEKDAEAKLKAEEERRQAEAERVALEARLSGLSPEVRAVAERAEREQWQVTPSAFVPAFKQFLDESPTLSAEAIEWIRENCFEKHWKGCWANPDKLKKPKQKALLEDLKKMVGE